ncbi:MULTISPECIES: transcriptional regulator FilR1 domain-containing protein [unclassified Haladaptatus]|uniref:helix-turn-helix transcriptional regulator n=1 Tax=unclassified Haladaptatus TaxID=2622732 RepID=UPI00209C6150|nr:MULTISPECIES: transcriptional regulator FilR1 domain-containing protein [unclassified Haladaptatus]MCO8243452.1 DUF1724 domain-containing protein [Haladaptatus sp. AB643]MCO8254861.1 DUF1724 domain-containing protein [Haladaptatus sp. AB618]
MSNDLARFLAGSPERRELLTHLRKQPGSPAELADVLSLSRRSIQRHLGQFVERGWATKSGGTYRLTTIGDCIVDEHTTYLKALDRIETFGPFLRNLPDIEHSPDPRWLDGASLVTVSPENPQAPIHAYLERVREFDSDHIRMISPVLSRLFHDVHAELALDGVHTELVMAEDTIDRARSLNPTEFKIVVSVGVLDLYRYPNSLGFGLTLGDDQLLMGAYDSGGHLEACVHSTDTEFLQWGEELFERYRGQADLIEPSFSLPFSLGP